MSDHSLLRRATIFLLSSEKKVRIKVWGGGAGFFLGLGGAIFEKKATKEGSITPEAFFVRLFKPQVILLLFQL